MFEIHLKMSHLVKISKYLLKEIGNPSILLVEKSEIKVKIVKI